MINKRYKGREDNILRITVSEIVDVTGGVILGEKTEDKLNKFVIHVSSNSREIEKNSLFVAIKGERTDGNKYVTSAFDNGASVSLVSEDMDEETLEKGVCIKTDDTLRAIQKLAGWYRKKYQIPVIGVTGSVGKTTTKEMIAAALGAGKKVLKTRGNLNSQLGVALMMFELTDEYDIGVIEMGMSEPGEMHRLTEMAGPCAAVITNIGVSHIGQLGSRENIRKEKIDIVRGFRKSGILLIPSNDEMLNAPDAFDRENVSREADVILDDSQIIYYGEDEKCLIKAENIHNEDKGVSFDVDIPGKGKHRVSLAVLGVHNVYNALAALAFADIFGVDIKAAIKGIEEYRPVAMRGEFFEKNGFTIIDDTYNASPDSMKSGLSVLWDKKCDGKRYAVLADILELGQESERLHREIGRYIAKNNEGTIKTDVLITVGREAAYIAKEAIKGSAEIKDGAFVVRSFEDRADALDFLKSNIKAGDLVLCKGSRGMQMDKIVKGVLDD